MITDLDEVFPMSVTPPRGNDALVTSRWENQIEDCDEEQLTNAIVTKPSLMNVTAEQPCGWRFKCKMASGRYPASWWQAELVDQHPMNDCVPASGHHANKTVQHVCKPVKVTQQVLVQNGCRDASSAHAPYVVGMHSLPVAFACLPR